jgi:hypothetical protein
MQDNLQRLEALTQGIRNQGQYNGQMGFNNIEIDLQILQLVASQVQSMQTEKSTEI